MQTRSLPHPDTEPELTLLLRRHRDRSKKTAAAIAADSWLSESYVSRLCSGERCNPSRDAVILLCLQGLELGVPETEEVLFAAGYRSMVARDYTA